MDTTTNETSNSMLTTLRQLGPARLGIIGAVVLGLLMFFVFVSLRVSTPDMKLLYADLTPESSAAVAAKLEETGIKYNVGIDGTRINVPEKDLGRARMLLAQDGLPGTGNIGYELFDKDAGFGTTNFMQNVKQVRAMEGELAKTITSLQPIRSARVHLVLPQRELFSRESRPASASVFLALKPGQRLNSEQIAGIQSLIASAVPMLKIDNVSIIDSNGTLLAQGKQDGGSMQARKAEEMRRDYELRTTQAIEDLLSRTLGYGKVRANVSADINFDRIRTNEEIFDPEKSVVRSTQTIEENSREREAAPGSVSVENNLPAAQQDLLQEGGPSAESNRVEETTNYEISKTIREQIREVGEVRRLSVAVVVDGSYITNAEGQRVYQPREQAEIDKISALVRSAIGFDAQRGDTMEVVNMQFADIDVTPDADDSFLGFPKSDLLDAIEILTVAIMIILVVVLVIQPMVGRILDAQGKDENDTGGGIPDLLGGIDHNPALAGPSYQALEGPSAEDDSPMIDMNRVEGQVKASTVRKVEEIVAAYPGETVSVIRNWMSQKD